MTIFDSTGTKSTFLLPQPLESESPTKVEKGFINVQDVTKIVLRTFSIDGWKFEAIEMSIRGTTYSFYNQNGQTIDKYSGQVTLTPN